MTASRMACLGALAGLLVPSPGAAQSLHSKQPPRISIAVEGPEKPPGPGERFDLAVRIVPNPGIHVYAPGSPDNIPVSVDMTPPAGLASEPAKFPKAEDFFFGPLAELMKVYSKPFIVTLPMKVEPSVGPKGASKGPQEIALTGIIKYQACDDRVCFPPQSTPFDTRLTIRLDRR